MVYARIIQLTGSGSQKSCIYEYRFHVNGNSAIVCKKFFLNTFDISNGRLSRLLTKNKEEGTPHLDGRDKHQNKFSVLEGLINDVKEHIKSFPVSESHYARKDNPHKRFLNPELCVVRMYDLYTEKCISQNKEIVGEHI